MTPEVGRQNGSGGDQLCLVYDPSSRRSVAGRRFEMDGVQKNACVVMGSQRKKQIRGRRVHDYGFSRVQKGVTVFVAREGLRRSRRFFVESLALWQLRGDAPVKTVKGLAQVGYLLIRKR